MQQEEQGRKSTRDEGYWYNVSTGQVEYGRQSAWEHRLGPYATEEEARRALQTATERTAQWDANDEQWES